TAQLNLNEDIVELTSEASPAFRARDRCMGNSPVDCRRSTRTVPGQPGWHRRRLLYDDRRWHIGWIGIDRHRVKIPISARHPPPAESAIVPLVPPGPA